ncbi:MAG: DUF4338 domain-containing protein [Dehalococcoidia bacterium]|nr:DUF4338 domain-containing protein [Dehalococcoidia bacterium]
MVTHDIVLSVQGRRFSDAELLALQQRIDAHPEWSRHRVAKDLCERWEWRTALGQLKTFAARSLLLKLAESHGLRLPEVRAANRRHPWGLGPSAIRPAPPAPAEPIAGSLARLQPLQWHLAGHGSTERARALACLRDYHYLGCNRPVGSHLLYLVQDAGGRDLAVHLVGAAAWQCAARDRYIGWSAPVRVAGLSRIANHSRFLLLPWVRVPQLASHVLSGLTRRIARDWRAQHGWPLELLETFVETGRFAGTAYRAANWQPVGATTGRTRQEKQHRAEASRKAVWVYPLHREFRRRLGVAGTAGGGR